MDRTKELDEKGFVVIPNFATQEECDTLKNRANSLVSSFDPSVISVSSTDYENKTSDYVMQSSSKVSFFFEDGAFDRDGNLIKPKGLSVNRIGHALHDVDPVFRSFSRSAAMQELYRSLGFKRPLPVQSMYIFKQPSIGGAVVPHQDSAFLTTSPPSCVDVWLALEAATEQNGCLFTAAGSHHGGVRARMTRDNSGKGVHWPSGKPSFADVEANLQPLEVAAGTLIVLHGSNVHGSSANTSENSRHAYTMHMVEGAEGVEWLGDNWLQLPPEMPFEPLYELGG